MKVIKRNYPLALVMTAGVLAFTAVLVFTGGPVRASETDDRIDSSFKKTYVYKTYLKDEAYQDQLQGRSRYLIGQRGRRDPQADGPGRCRSFARRFERG